MSVLRRLHCRLVTIPAAIRHRLLVRWLGQDWQRALSIGRFRLAGEVHQWMYDRYSLARLLDAAGFVEPAVRDATTSAIPNWCTYNLDTTPEGVVIKPDLFFMEAVKPEGCAHVQP